MLVDMLKRCSLFLAATIFVLPVAAAGPAIEIPDDTFDFGKTPQHAKVNHSFWIKSVGEDTLRITKVYPGCGCTEAPLKDSVLAPGDSTMLEIIFSTRSYRGHVSKQPYLKTNASDEKVYLKIKAELLPEPQDAMPVSVNPHRIDVSQFGTKPRRKARFFIENKSDRDFEIRLIDADNRWFDIELPKKVEAGESAPGTIIVHKNAIEKEFEQSATFEINDERKSRYTLAVKRVYRVLDKE